MLRFLTSSNSTYSPALAGIDHLRWGLTPFKVSTPKKKQKTQKLKKNNLCRLMSLLWILNKFVLVPAQQQLHRPVSPQQTRTTARNSSGRSFCLNGPFIYHNCRTWLAEDRSAICKYLFSISIIKASPCIMRDMHVWWRRFTHFTE